MVSNDPLEIVVTGSIPVRYIRRYHCDIGVM